MTPMISIVIPGRPVPWARARSKGAHRYTPEPQANYMAVVATIGRAAMSRAGYAPFQGPLEMTCRATYRYPQTWSQHQRDTIRYRDVKPDATNIAKLIEDALNGVAYADDAQIVRGTTEKVYGSPEGVVVTIIPLADQPNTRPV